MNQLPQPILSFFESINMPLEHYPEDGDLGEMWQFDGADESGVGPLVQVYVSTNGRGEPSLFGSVDLTDLGGSDISVAFPLETWMEDGPAWIKQHLVEVGLL